MTGKVGRFLHQTAEGIRSFGRLLIIQGLCQIWVSDCGEKAGKLNRVSGAGTLSLRDLPPDRSLGRRRLRPHAFSQDAAGGEREQPSTVDSATQRPGQSGPKRRVLLLVPPLPQLRRRIQLVCRARAICGPAVRKTMLSPPSRSGQCVLAQNVPTELQLRAETCRSARA